MSVSKMAATTALFAVLQSSQKMGRLRYFHTRILGSCIEIGRVCMISCMHAFRLNWTGKLSVWEVYHNHEYHDYDQENYLQTLHTAMVHSIHHPRLIATSFQTVKPTFHIAFFNLGAIFKSLNYCYPCTILNDQYHRKG
jgi:hypothetical protein